MQLFKSCFTKFEPAVINDDYFGKLSNDRNGNWSGDKWFEATKSMISFSLRTGGNPPKPEQVLYFREVESKFTDLWEKSRQRLVADIPDFADGTSAEQMYNKFNVEHLSFWSIATKPYKWEIDCSTGPDNPIFHIQMNEFEYQDCTMDD